MINQLGMNELTTEELVFVVYLSNIPKIVSYLYSNKDTQFGTVT